jgi:PncC family amidohydrolase
MSAERLLEVLRDRRLSLATAESLTGGGLGALVTSVPGASDVYVGGVVSYATRVKTSLLGVPAHVVDEHGVVSAQCAEAMAVGVRRLLDADVAVSTTGVAGPDRQEGKPVGTAYVAVSTPAGAQSLALALRGDRAAVREAAVEAAVDLALAACREGPPDQVAGAR